ncbi:MAG: hypothetical protein INF43_03610 [Alphaproteobacteria bacterium]|jgi:hypothetical protein|nr:hypothetical protein [Alphaproteobacteria bacterium]
MATTPTTPHAIQRWRQEQFMPWLHQAQAYQLEKAQQQARLRQHLPALQTMVGLLLEGQTNRAVLAWNGLGLEPALADIVLSRDGEQVLLRAKGGRTEILPLTEIIDALQALTASPPAPTNPAAANPTAFSPAPDPAAGS